MNHIITPEEVREYGRAMSQHIDKKVLEALIQETENMDIRPVLGAVFFQSLVHADEEDPLIRILLEGGHYPSTFDPNFGKGGKSTFDKTFDSTFVNKSQQKNDSYFQGLKSAVAYYVQAKLVKANDNQITRFGVMQKDSEYGSRPSRAERNDQYNDLCAIADQYLQDTLVFLRKYASKYPDYNRKNETIRNNRTIYRIIGE